MSRFRIDPGKWRPFSSLVYEILRLRLQNSDPTSWYTVGANAGLVEEVKHVGGWPMKKFRKGGCGQPWLPGVRQFVLVEFSPSSEIGYPLG